MTAITQRMREELVRRNYAKTTIPAPICRSFEGFRQHFQKRLDDMTPDDIRRYQVYLLENRKLGVGTVVGHVAALRFLYVKTLKRHDMKQDLPYPKHQKRLPIVLSQEEVTRPIDSSQNLHYTMLLTMYSTGVRRSYSYPDGIGTRGDGCKHHPTGHRRCGRRNSGLLGVLGRRELRVYPKS